MHYYIDGYNLLFRAYGSSGDLRQRRTDLIHRLNTKVGFLRLSVTLVFDSQYCLGQGTKSHYEHLEIQFTPQGVTADEFIIHELEFALKPRQETVVTSDNHLAWMARNMSARTETIEEFLAWLEKRYHNQARQLRIKKESPIKEKSAQGPSLFPPQEPAFGADSHSKASFDYYLFEFEERFKALSLEETRLKEEKLKSNKKKEKPKKHKKLDSPKKKENISEMERWLKLFQQEP